MLLIFEMPVSGSDNLPDSSWDGLWKGLNSEIMKLTNFSVLICLITNACQNCLKVEELERKILFLQAEKNKLAGHKC